MDTAATGSDLIDKLTAAEVTIAERTAGLGITSLENDMLPKMGLFSALAWVYTKRSDLTLTFDTFATETTTGEVMSILGFGDDDGDEPDELEQTLEAPVEPVTGDLPAPE